MRKTYHSHINRGDKMDDIFLEVFKSKKYSLLDDAIVRRVCEEAVIKYSKRKDAIKATKNQLYCIHEAFLQDDCYKKAREILKETDCLDKDTVLRILSLHSSTKERLGFISDVYNFLDQYINDTSEIVDVGCGFNPFAVVFYHRVPKSYKAYDISIESVTLLNEFLHTFNPPYNYHAEILDAVIDVPPQKADVMLLFKLLPLLQKQKKGRAFEFLKKAKFRIAIVSFPLKSISGKEKGMLEFYSNFFEEGMISNCQIIDKKNFENELFYVIKKI